VHHVGILYDQFMMHGQRNIKKICVMFEQLIFIVKHYFVSNSVTL